MHIATETGSSRACLLSPLPYSPEETLDAYLPFVAPVRYPKGRMLPAGSIHMVSVGIVHTFRPLLKGEHQGLGICGPDAIFGLLGESGEVISREALVMSWPRNVFEHPAAQAALAAHLARLNVRLIELLEESRRIAFDRLALALLRAVRSVGRPVAEPNRSEWRTLPALTHALLASEVCTSREVVTACMVRLRRAGAVVYTRKEILVHPANLMEVSSSSLNGVSV